MTLPAVSRLGGSASAVAAVGASLALFALAACGSSTRTINTPVLLAVLKQAGFRRLTLFSRDAATRSTARKLNYRAFSLSLGADVVYAGGRNIFELRFSATRLSSIQAAEKRYANDRALMTGHLSRVERRDFPKGFDPRRLQEVRVCNVLLTSYHAAGAGRALTRRFARAVSLLRRRCE